MPVSYPVVNGIRFDFSSIEFNLNGKRFPGIKSLNYNDSLSPGFVRGTAAQVLGRTRGQYDAEGTIEIYREDADDFMVLVSLVNPALGLYEVNWDLNVTWFELIQGAGPAVQNDLIKGCRIKKLDSSNSQGSDPSTIKYDFHALYIVHNGKFPIGIPQTVGTRF